ncbi:MAG: YgjV family protein [Oscillospiraceae bacterium]|nr:YgjV family protein [Oscillospiraceae bacterium]
METLSYALSLLGLAAMLTASLIKGKRMDAILLFVFLGNMLISTSYLVGGTGINGAAAGYLGSFQTVVNYLFLRKDKPLPKRLIVLFFISSILLNVWIAKGFDIFVALIMLAGVAFLMGIISKNGAKYRFWAILNITIFCIYDIVSGSWNVLLTHGFQLLVTLVGAIIHDRKKKNKMSDEVLAVE